MGDAFSQGLVVVGVHKDSVLSRLHLIIVLEAPSRELHTSCPWQLLYVDDLVISGTAGKVEDMEIRDGEGPVSEQIDYGDCINLNL